MPPAPTPVFIPAHAGPGCSESDLEVPPSLSLSDNRTTATTKMLMNQTNIKDLEIFLGLLHDAGKSRENKVLDMVLLDNAPGGPAADSPVTGADRR